MPRAAQESVSHQERARRRPTVFDFRRAQELDLFLHSSMTAGFTRAFLEGTLRNDGDGRFRPRGRSRRRFRRPAQGPSSLEPTSGCCLPGYRDVVEQLHPYRDCWPMRPAGGDAGLAARAGFDQGWPAGLRAVVSATLRPARQSLWRRARAATGRTTTSALAGWPRPRPNSPRAFWTRIGQRISCTPTTGRPRSCRPTSPGTVRGCPRS